MSGIEISVWSDDSIDVLERELTRRGLQTRSVRLESGEIGALHAPALISVRDGGWVLMTRNRTAAAIVRDGEGARRIRHPELAGIMGEWCLEVDKSPAEGAGLWQIITSAITRRPRLVFRIALLGLVIAAAALVPPQLTRIAIDQAVPEGAFHLLSAVAVGLALTGLFQAWLGWVRGRSALYLTTRVEANVGQFFFHRMLRLPFLFLNGKTPAELLQAVTGVGVAHDLLANQTWSVLLDGLTVVVLLVGLSLTFAPLAIGIAAFTIIILATAIVVGRAQRHLQADEIDQRAAERDLLVDMIAGVAMLKAAGAEDHVLGEWLRRFRRELQLTRRRQRVGLWYDAGTELLTRLMSVVIIVCGGIYVLSRGLPVGALVAGLQMSVAFIASVGRIADAYLGFAVVQPQIAGAHEVIAVAPQKERAPVPGGLNTPGTVAARNLWFRYASGGWIVKDLSLDVEAGEKRWIAGPSGAGKTTVLRLLAGIVDPEEGTVTIGGRAPGEVRDSIVYLPQSVRLYGGSIYSNLSLFSGRASRDRLMSAAEATGLHRFVASLPLGYDTMITAGGGMLSGGERQLITLTAVMASDRRLVILDEAFESLDFVSRSWIEKNEWFANRTVIYASHVGDLGGTATVIGALS